MVFIGYGREQRRIDFCKHISSALADSASSRDMAGHVLDFWNRVGADGFHLVDGVMGHPGCFGNRVAGFALFSAPRVVGFSLCRILHKLGVCSAGACGLPFFSLSLQQLFQLQRNF